MNLKGPLLSRRERPWFMTMIFDVDIYLQRCVYSEHSSLCLAPSRSRPSIVLEQKKTNILVLCIKCLYLLKSTFSTLICFKLFVVFFRERMVKIGLLLEILLL